MICGYRLCRLSLNVFCSSKANSLFLDLYTFLKSCMISLRSFTRTFALIFLEICTTHLWIFACGNVSLMAFSIPFNPSVQISEIRSKPRCLKLFKSDFHTSADSFGAISYPGISLLPSTVIPIAIWIASLATVSLLRDIQVASI